MEKVDVELTEANRQLVEGYAEKYDLEPEEVLEIAIEDVFEEINEYAEENNLSATDAAIEVLDLEKK